MSMGRKYNQGEALASLLLVAACYTWIAQARDVHTVGSEGWLVTRVEGENGQISYVEK